MLNEGRLRKSYDQQVFIFEESKRRKLENIQKEREKVKRKFDKLKLHYNELALTEKETKEKVYPLSFEEFAVRSQVQKATSKPNTEFDLSLIPEELREHVRSELQQKGYSVD